MTLFFTGRTGLCISKKFSHTFTWFIINQQTLLHLQYLHFSPAKLFFNFHFILSFFSLCRYTLSPWQLLFCIAHSPILPVTAVSNLYRKNSENAGCLNGKIL